MDIGWIKSTPTLGDPQLITYLNLNIAFTVHLLVIRCLGRQQQQWYRVFTVNIYIESKIMFGFLNSIGQFSFSPKRTKNGEGMLF